MNAFLISIVYFAAVCLFVWHTVVRKGHKKHPLSVFTDFHFLFIIISVFAILIL
jgi:hypothetical protein